MARPSFCVRAALPVICALGCVSACPRTPCPPLGWDQVVRLRHLFAVRSGRHLVISEDGRVRGSAEQTSDSLMEIRPVAPGQLVIRGVTAARFLCARSDGTLYAPPVFSSMDCTFREQIFPDGFSVFVSSTHGSLLSLGNQRQRSRGLDQDAPALARFLPRVSTLDQNPAPTHAAPPTSSSEAPEDVMDSFGKLSQIIHSPSFHRR